MTGGRRIGAGRKHKPTPTRSKIVQARLTPEENARLEATAKERGTTVSGIIRLALGLEP